MSPPFICSLFTCVCQALSKALGILRYGRAGREQLWPLSDMESHQENGCRRRVSGSQARLSEWRHHQPGPRMCKPWGTRQGMEIFADFRQHRQLVCGMFPMNCLGCTDRLGKWCRTQLEPNFHDSMCSLWAVVSGDVALAASQGGTGWARGGPVSPLGFLARLLPGGGQAPGCVAVGCLSWLPCEGTGWSLHTACTLCPGALS